MIISRPQTSTHENMHNHWRLGGDEQGGFYWDELAEERSDEGGELPFNFGRMI
jgi:hypothetical protein